MYICRDINASIHFLKYPNEPKQRDIVPAHKTTSKLFKQHYMGISIHKTEPVNSGSSDGPVNFQGLNFGTKPQVNNLVARNVSITA